MSTQDAISVARAYARHAKHCNLNMSKVLINRAMVVREWSHQFVDEELKKFYLDQANELERLSKI